MPAPSQPPHTSSSWPVQARAASSRAEAAAAEFDLERVAIGWASLSFGVNGGDSVDLQGHLKGIRRSALGVVSDGQKHRPFSARPTAARAERTERDHRDPSEHPTAGYHGP